MKTKELFLLLQENTDECRDFWSDLERVPISTAVVATKRNAPIRKIVVVSGAAMTLIIGLYLISSSSNILSPNNPDATNPITRDEKSSSLLITATLYDNYNPSGGEGLLDPKQTYISDMLKNRLDNAKEQKFVYRTVVSILAAKDGSYSNGQLETKINEAKEKLKSAREEYLLLANQDSDNIQILKDKEGEIDFLSNTLLQLELELRNESKDRDMNEKLEFVKELGAMNIESIAESSDERNDIHGDGYFIDLTADMIRKMDEEGGYIIRLALPKRIKNYDIKLSDSLTVLVEKMSENDTIHVAVIGIIDERNDFALEPSRRLAANPDYNAHLSRDFNSYKEYEQSTAGVGKYINDILKRNDLVDKRKNKSLNDVSYTPSPHYFVTAGFEAELKKSEILELVLDDEVKVIYPMQYKNNNYEDE